MVKLIRLNTSNSDAHFKASFDTDITINENSKIALKNLTFESDFATYNPTRDTSHTNFVGNALVLNDYSHQYIESKTYTRSNVEELENEVVQSYNRTINLQDGKTNSRGHAELYGQFGLSKNKQNKYALEFRQSRAMSVLEGAYLKDSFLTKPPYDADTKGPFEQPSFPQNKIESDVDDDELKLTTGTASVVDERYSFISRSGLGISKSAGVFYCRIHTSTVNGVNANHNGFSIGLSFGNPRKPDTNSPNQGVDDKVRNCEIIYQDANTNYFSRLSNKGVASVPADTGIAPNLVNGGALNAHDIIMFKIDNNPNNVKVISAHIYTNAGGGGSTENLIFSHPLSDEELNGVITPYIYLRGARANIILDMVRFTPDPFYEIDNVNVVPLYIDQGGGFAFSPDDPVAISQADATHEFTGGTSATAPTQAMRTTIAIYYPTNDGNDLSDVGSPPPNLSIAMGGELAEILGFNKLGDKSELLRGPANGLVYNSNVNNDGYNLNSIGFRIDAQNESLFDRQDSYIVESMTLPLLSYNSAVDRTNTTPRTSVQTLGSRKNILATIPENADDGLCQYEPNEVVYIDIKNDNKLNIRNLELRVLDNNFQPIRIVGEADLTLLIDN